MHKTYCYIKTYTTFPKKTKKQNGLNKIYNTMSSIV